MPAAHELYVAKALGMQKRISGIDLEGEHAQVEVKFRLLDPAGRHPKKWVVVNHQKEYSNESNGQPTYWSLGFYRLAKPVASLPHNLKSVERLEQIVTERIMHLVSWDWMKQFPPHYTSGRTQLTEWENILLYARADCLPKISHTFQTPKGPMHLTEGVNPKHFPELRKYKKVA